MGNDLENDLAAIALTAQILAPTSQPGLVGNLHLIGAEEQQWVRRAFEVDDDLEANVRWVLEARKCQRNLLEKWLAPIEARIV